MSQLVWDQGMLAEVFWSPIYLAAWFWITAGIYRLAEEKRAIQTIGKLEYALMYSLAFASLGHGIIESTSETLIIEPLMANVLMAMTSVIPSFKRVSQSVVLWFVLSTFVLAMGFTQLDDAENSLYFNTAEIGLGYVISVAYAVLSLGVLLSLSHYSRLEFQDQFEKETKTKGVLDRLNKMVAHNLRSPLATLQMQLEIDKLKGLDVERYESALHALIQTTEDMMSFDADAAQMLSHELVKKVANISDRVEIETLGSGNFNMSNVRGVFYGVQNFVGNALKHTQGKVRFSLMGDSHDWVIKIADDGVGMSEKTLSQLGTKLESKSGGLGIGLMLTKELADINGFTIVYQSRLGLGTVVFIGKDCYTIESNLLKNWPTNVISCSHKEKIGMQPMPSSFVDKINTRNDN